MEVRLTFLGVGSASQLDLGHASAVIELENSRVLIDCGPGTVRSYLEKYQSLPDALFITHCHLDHVADFENFFIKCWFRQPERFQPKVFVPVGIIPLLNERVGNYPGALAEGGVNFWDAFQLIPVDKSFVFSDLTFTVLPVRHHKPKSAFGLYLPKAFFYTGDTRPIPEIFEHVIDSDTMIFHDCGVIGNPSHTGIDDVKREYPQALIDRIVFYHYTSTEEEKEFKKHNMRVAKKNETFEFILPSRNSAI